MDQAGCEQDRLSKYGAPRLTCVSICTCIMRLLHCIVVCTWFYGRLTARSAVQNNAARSSGPWRLRASSGCSCAIGANRATS